MSENKSKIFQCTKQNLPGCHCNCPSQWDGLNLSIIVPSGSGEEEAANSINEEFQLDNVEL